MATHGKDAQGSSGPDTETVEMADALSKYKTTKKLLRTLPLDWDLIASTAVKGLKSVEKCDEVEFTARPVDYRIFFMTIVLRSIYARHVTYKNEPVSEKNLRDFYVRKGAWLRVRPWLSVLGESDAVIEENLGTSMSPEILKTLRKFCEDLRSTFDKKKE